MLFIIITLYQFSLSHNKNCSPQHKQPTCLAGSSPGKRGREIGELVGRSKQKKIRAMAAQWCPAKGALTKAYGGSSAGLAQGPEPGLGSFYCFNLFYFTQGLPPHTGLWSCVSRVGSLSLLHTKAPQSRRQANAAQVFRSKKKNSYYKHLKLPIKLIQTSFMYQCPWEPELQDYAEREGGCNKGFPAFTLTLHLTGCRMDPKQLNLLPSCVSEQDSLYCQLLEDDKGKGNTVSTLHSDSVLAHCLMSLTQSST